MPSKKPRWCTYRSFRNFDVVNFNMDLESNLSQLFFSEENDVNETYEAFTNAILSVTNKHVHLNRRKFYQSQCLKLKKLLKAGVGYIRQNNLQFHHLLHCTQAINTYRSLSLI